MYMLNKIYKLVTHRKTFFLALVLLACSINIHAQDLVADNMLLFQRSVGGWPKHWGNANVDYTKELGPAQKADVNDDKNRNDATIDNDATNKEIRYLLKTYKGTNNPAYLNAAENGIRYLLKAQYANGGWPQFYPDTSFYRSEITYNDNAMINVMNLLQDVCDKVNDCEVVNKSFVPVAEEAVARGIDCILKTQITVNGKLTVWCAQYDAKTLLPAKARSYELVSLSGSESVGVVLFLMRVQHPSLQIKKAINAAVEWFEKSEIKGYKVTTVKAPSQPKGTDRIVVKDDSSIIWARFYDINTNEPFFSGRDGIKKTALKDIEYERRNGYAWYGTWPETLLKKDYPKWVASNS